MRFIDMTPAWDYNEPVRTVCIEHKFKLNNWTIRTSYKRLIIRDAQAAIT